MMKAFDEWFECYQSRDIRDGVFDIGAEAWRAALEWTLETAKELDKQDAPICMNDIIEQELREIK